MPVSTIPALRARPAPAETTPYGFKGTVSTRKKHLDLLAGLAAAWPVGAEIRHAGGRLGRIALDHPANVPGRFDGKPTQVCVGSVPLLCARWENSEHLTWIAWVPVTDVQRTGRRWNNNPKELKA